MSRFWRFILSRTARGDLFETCETTQPWVVYTYFVPDWITRVLGRTTVRCECCICGVVKFPTMRLQRWGKVVDRGHHPARRAFLDAHVHQGVNRHPMQWERPLRNAAVLRPGDLEEIAELAVERAKREASP